MNDDWISRKAAIDALYHHLVEKTWDECAQILHEVPPVKCINNDRYAEGLRDGASMERERMSCDDAISRQAVLNTLYSMDKALDENRTIEEYKELLKECYEQLPSVAHAEKTGHWIRVTDKTGHLVWECDKCGWQQRYNTDFCNDCGAKMVDPQESEVQDADCD